MPKTRKCLTSRVKKRRRNPGLLKWMDQNKEERSRKIKVASLSTNLGENLDSSLEMETQHNSPIYSKTDTIGDNGDSALDITRPLAFVDVKMEPEGDSFNNDLAEGVAVKEESIEEEECPVNSIVDEDASLSVVNLKEDIEITVDEIKQEIQVPTDICADDPQNSEFSTIITASNVDLTPFTPLHVKTPARTYQRSTPNRKRPLSWGAEENTGSCIKLRKTDHLSDKNEEKKIEGADKNGVLRVDIQEGTYKSESTRNENSKEKEKSKNIIDLNLNPTCDIENNQGVYDRRHSCFICKERYLNMEIHLLSRHLRQKEMSCITKLPVNSALRKERLISLRRIGDMQHNIRVLQNGCGMLIVLRQSEEFIGKATTSEFLPCTFCMGFVHRSQLKRHHTICVLKFKLDGLDEILLITSQATLMCAVSHYDLDKELLDLNVSVTYEIMANNIFAAARNDPLINMLAKYMLVGKKSGTTSKESAKNVVYKMACLMLTVKKLSGNKRIRLKECLAVKNLDMLISAVLSLLAYVKGPLEKYELYILYYRQLVNCIFGLRGKYLAEGQLVQANNYLEFYHQFNKEWQKQVSTVLKHGNLSSNSILPDLPLTENVVNLKECLTTKVEYLTAYLKEHGAGARDASDTWFVLAERTMCLLCLFNAADFHLIESLTIIDYALRPDWRVDKVKDYQLKMSSITYHMAEKRFVVKTGKKETILLFTGVVKQAIDTLIAMRNVASVCPENPYVFAEQFHPKNSLKAGVCFFKTCTEPMCGQLNIDALNNKMRQYLSYMTLISDMTPEEVEWLKKFYFSTKKGNHRKSIFDPLTQAMHMYGFDSNLKKDICRTDTNKEEPNCLEEEPELLTLPEQIATLLSAEKEPNFLEEEPDPLSLSEPITTSVSAQKELNFLEEEPVWLSLSEPITISVSAQKVPGVPEGFSQDAPMLAPVKTVKERRKETIKITANVHDDKKQEEEAVFATSDYLDSSGNVATEDLTAHSTDSVEGSSLPLPPMDQFTFCNVECDDLNNPLVLGEHLNNCHLSSYNKVDLPSSPDIFSNDFLSSEKDCKLFSKPNDQKLSDMCFSSNQSENYQLLPSTSKYNVCNKYPESPVASQSLELTDRYCDYFQDCSGGSSDANYEEDECYTGNNHLDIDNDDLKIKSEEPNEKPESCDSSTRETKIVVDPLQESENATNKTKLTKKNKNFCLYCKSLVLNFSRHIVGHHHSEVDVQKIIATPKGKKRKNLISLLRNKGNFVNASTGTIKQVKRHNLLRSGLALRPFCLAFYAKNLLRHKRKCLRNDVRSAFVSATTNDLFIEEANVRNELAEKVFPRMHFNKPIQIAMKDALICAFGSNYLITHKQSHVRICSQKMRELAMILLEMKKIDQNIKNLSDCLKPEQFGNLIEAAKTAAGFEESTGAFRETSFVLNVGTSLKKCCEITFMKSMKECISNDSDMNEEFMKSIQEEMNRTILLIKSKWKTDILRKAASYLSSKKMSKISSASSQ